MAAPDPYTSFMSGLEGSFKIGQSLRSDREKKALSQATLMMKGFDDYKELAKSRQEMLKAAGQLVKELDLSDGSNAALNAVYNMLEANQGSDNPVKIVREQIKEDGISKYRLSDPAPKKEEPAADVDTQTTDALLGGEEGVAGVKAKLNETTATNTREITSEVGPNAQEESKTQDAKTVKDKNLFAKIFDVKGRINERAIELATIAAGGEDILGGYMSYRQTGSMPVFAELELPEGVSPVAGYMTPLGKGWTFEKIADKLGTKEQAYAFAMSLPENLSEQKEYILSTSLAAAKGVYEQQLDLGAIDPAEIKKHAEFRYLKDQGFFLPNGKPNLEQYGGSYQAWENSLNLAVQDHSEKPATKILAACTTIDSCEKELAQLPASVRSGQITIEERIDLEADITSTIKHLEDADKRENKRKISKASDQDTFLAIDSRTGNALGIAKVDTVTGLTTINGKDIDQVIEGGGYYLTTDKDLDRMETVRKDFGAGFNTKLTGFANYAVRASKMASLVKSNPDVLTAAGGIARNIGMASKTMDFFIELAFKNKGENDVNKLLKVMTNEESNILSSLLGEDRAADLTKLSKESALFLSLKIQTAYALAQALGQEGKGLSDTDLRLQLESIAGTSDPAAFDSMLLNITDNLYKSIEGERKTYIDEFNGRGINQNTINAQPIMRDTYVLDYFSGAGRDYVVRSQDPNDPYRTLSQDLLSNKTKVVDSEALKATLREKLNRFYSRQGVQAP
jgi:hypothetical protein